MTRSVTLFGLLVSFTAPALLCAKGDTVAIEITGGLLREPIRATDPVIEQFNVWAGEPSSGQGFVYLPGSSDPRWQRNVTSIYRGVEGHWFRAADAWDRFVQPLIASAENLSRRASGTSS